MSVIEWGAGSAAVVVDLRGPALISVGPANCESTIASLGGQIFYRSRSGLSGAARLPRKPWLRGAKTYRPHVASELPTGGIGPWVPVDRDDTIWDAPIIRGVDSTEHRTVVTCSCGWLGGEELSQHDLGKIPHYWGEHGVTLWAPKRHVRYLWRRVAWSIARNSLRAWHAQRWIVQGAQGSQHRALQALGVHYVDGHGYFHFDRHGIPVAAIDLPSVIAEPQADTWPWNQGPAPVTWLDDRQFIDANGDRYSLADPHLCQMVEEKDWPALVARHPILRSA